MAIAFARPEYVSRSSGANACCKSAYNARGKIKDTNSGIIYNWQKRSDNVYHDILLPDHVDRKFKNVAVFANEVELAEKRKDSQLYVEWLLALPKEEEITLEMKEEIIKEFIDRKGWIKEGLGVQIDIHKPHEGDVNWHAHLLVTTRRFRQDGLGLETKKAVDLQPEVKYGKVQKTIEIDNHIFYRDVLNDKFKEWGLELKADLPGVITQEHIGPIRMRSVLNEAANRNEARRLAEIEHLSNGEGLLDKVTRSMSVFSKDDLIRAVKCISNPEAKDRLIEDALSNKAVVALYNEDGTKTQYFTTDEVRREEEKILRLSGYVANLDNVFRSSDRGSYIDGHLKEAAKILSNEQYIALSELVNAGSGLSILRGRAGVGKSFVLKQLAEIANKNNIHAIGLSPTHKAKEVLASSGFKSCETVKGMLFKLANGRFSLPKHSLLVVDEAGMIGNDDYHELLRVAATRKCSVILSGDERQLASVQRGGMFEVFARVYGSSTIFDIKRQSNNWGREVAQEFSVGNAGGGISILEQEGRIKRDESALESMQNLLVDWQGSNYALSDRLILAVKNKDVAALNHGVRQYLKQEGVLSGSEIEIAGNHYMKGDRILIGKTVKSLGLVNGDICEILEASTVKFVISLDKKNESSGNQSNNRVIEFNPSEFYSFKHGYATTVFKAQGASIKDVYVFHDGFSGLRNSYVALSRNIDELRLYINNAATFSKAHLIRQLSYDPDSGVSLNYHTLKELENIKTDKIIKEKNIAVRAIVSTVDFLAKTAIRAVDKYLPKSEYYNYKEPQVKSETASEVIDKIYEQSHGVRFVNDEVEEKLVVGGNSSMVSKKFPESQAITASSGAVDNQAGFLQSTTAMGRVTKSAKDRFYAKADYVRSRAQPAVDLQAKRDSDNEYLRREAGICAERIARDLLGDPNLKLSNGRELRYGDTGKMAIRISGERSGTWYDFARGEGGDIFDLVKDVKACDFKTAADYLRGMLGIERELGTGGKRPNSNLGLVDNLEVSNEYEKHVKDRLAQDRENLQKQVVVDKLVQRSKDITEGSIAFKYLTETRGINCSLGEDIKTAGVYTHEKNRYLPAVIAYARDENGIVTGGVQIILNTKGLKADIEVPKKSFGRISGSFVNLGKNIYANNAKGDNLTSGGDFLTNSRELEMRDKITIIAEGIETGLSVKQALSRNNSYSGLEIKILCSLGINNISNYQASIGEKIIIAADNDGENSITNRTIEKAKSLLEEKGAYVETVRPEMHGDFNDMLKNSGESDISRIFEPAIEKHTAVSLNRYLELQATSGKVVTLNNLDRENLAFIQKYALPEKDIIESYRQGDNKGRMSLEDVRKSLEFAANCYRQNKDILLEAKRFGYDLNEIQITKTMIGMNDEEANSFCKKTRNSHLENYLQQNVGEFTKQKREAIYTDKIKTIIIAEQKFLKETYELLKPPIDGISGNVAYMIRAGEVASKRPELLNKVFETADYITSQCRGVADSLYKILSRYNNTDHINTELLRQIETYKAFGQPVNAAYERSTSKTIESALISIKKEQNMLADLHGNIEYHSSNQELMSKVELAYTQRKNKDFDKLEAIAQKSLELGAETEETLLKKLQHTTDLKVTYNKLDQAIEVHQINKRIFGLNNQISQSQTAGDVLKAMEKKESFLINLDKNIKYPELHKQLLELGKLAKISYLQQVPEKLNALVKQSLSLTTFSEQSIVDELKNTKNIEKTCQKFEVAIDMQVINKSLLKLDTQKQEARTLDKVMVTIKQEQEFLAGLHGNVKHLERHNDNLINSIKNAYDDMRTDKLDRLSKLVTFLEKNTNDHTAIISTLKSTNNITETHQTLLKTYQAKCVNSINNKISILDTGKTITLDNKKFDCPIKFLDYLTKTRTHEYFPHREVQKIQSKVTQNHKQLELSKSKGLELEL